MAPTKVLVIGGGIAGPVLAIFLKQRGYEPIVYERLQEFADLGVGLLLQPNGLRVLSFIPGLVESVPGANIARHESYSALFGDKGLLGANDRPSLLAATYGFGQRGVRRTTLHGALIKACQQHDIEVKWDHECKSLEQHIDSVTVKFVNGTTDTGSFVIGCDGLHSAIRIGLFGNETPTFTGLTQTGGICMTPSGLAKSACMINWYGDGAHLIAYPITSTETSWALTLHESQARETWHAAGNNILEKIQSSPYALWEDGAGELVRVTERVVKYGLYDRPELASWHIGRVALLGDAAHPTSPHLGQGANQALEDIYHLTHLLDKHNEDRQPLDTPALSKIFAAYEQVRIPRTSMLVKSARKMGEMRVAVGSEAAKDRNDAFRQSLADESALTDFTKLLYDDSLNYRST